MSHLLGSRMSSEHVQRRRATEAPQFGRGPISELADAA
jgi:hypothetical protein